MTETQLKMNANNEANPPFTTQIISVMLKDGVETKLKLLKSTHNPSAAVIICVPAMGMSARSYETLAKSIVKKGFNAVTVDLRGNGYSSVRVSNGVDFSYFSIIDNELPQYIKTVNEHFAGNDVYLFGHSLGGQLNVLYNALNPSAVKGLILMASCSVYYKGWSFPKNLAILFFTQLALLITILLGYFPGKKLFFGGTEAKGVMQDWAYNARTGRYKLINSTDDFEQLTSTLSTKVLAISLQGDQFAPPKAVANLTDKLKSANVTSHYLLADEMQIDKPNHFNWLKNPDTIVDKIADWVTNH